MTRLLPGWLDLVKFIDLVTFVNLLKQWLSKWLTIPTTDDSRYNGASENHRISTGENQPSQLDWRMRDYANLCKHCLFVVSDRGEVSSYLTNLGFRIQIMKLIISDGGEGDIGIFYTSPLWSRQNSWNSFLPQNDKTNWKQYKKERQ